MQNLNCNLIVNAHNKMYGIVDMQPAPRYWLCYNPIKDTHVREDLPTYNLGNRTVMYIGNKDGYRYRAFMAFDINSIPEDMFITQAKLTLYFPSDNAFENFELSVLNRDWHEEGTTWNYQPTRREILETSNLSDGSLQVVLNVKNIVEKWYKNEEDNYGFLLKASDSFEHIDQFKGIFSRESESPPELCIEYLDPHVKNPRRSNLNSNIIIKQNDQNILNASLEVPVYRGESDLLSNINVFNHKMLIGIVSVNKRFLFSSLIVKRQDENVLNSSLIIIQKGQENFNSEIIVNKNILSCNIQIRYNSYINANLTISSQSMPFIFCSINIRPISQINASLYIYKHDESVLESNILIHKSWINVNLKVRRFDSLNAFLNVRPTSSIDSNINIRVFTFLYSSLETRKYFSLSSSININPLYLNCNLMIRGKSNIPSQIKVRPAFSLNSNIRIVYKIDFDANLIVKQRFFSDIYCSLLIDSITEVKAYGFIL